jgi:acyl-CoA dehydrogenase
VADTSYLDWPFFDAAHRDFAHALSEWAAHEIAPLAVQEPKDRAALDARAKSFAARLGAANWLKPCATLEVRKLALAREILAYHSGLADFAFAMQGLGTASITLFGDDALKERFVPPAIAGTSVAAFAISEADAGSDVAAMTTRAGRDGSDYVIDGAKTWISNAGLADHYVVFARTGEADGARGLSAFVVPAQTRGLSVAERIDVVAPHPLGTLTFDGVRVPASHRLGQGGDGFKVAMTTLDVFRPTVGAAALGFARRALDEATTRAKSRRAFGQPLAEFQLIQEKLADMAVKIDTAALLIYRAAWTKDSRPGTRITREAAMAKLYATEAAQDVVDQAVQIFGGAGVVAGATVERLYREVRALRIYEGTSEIQKLVIAAQILKT